MKKLILAAVLAACCATIPALGQDYATQLHTLEQRAQLCIDHQMSIAPPHPSQGLALDMAKPADTCLDELIKQGEPPLLAGKAVLNVTLALMGLPPAH